MADELRLKIVLDDGSVKEGFLSVEKQADNTSKKIGKSFDKKGTGLDSLGKSAEGLSEKISEATGSVAGLGRVVTSTLGPVGVISASLVVAAGAAFKFALAGEQVNAINTQFDKIATSAGLSVDKFKDSIIASTQGLIDDEDALSIATKGIVALGDNAAKLPQILDASRNVSRALGKDFKDTFGDLSQFVETGNARVLKNLGIVLDLDKAYQNAARSVGLTTAELTEQQKQTVRANLLLDEIPKKFGAAADSVTPLKDAFDRLKVSSSNALEGIQSGFANAFTKAFLDNADLSNVGITRLNTTLTDNKKRLEEINPEIEKYISQQSRSSVEVIQLNKLLRERAQILQESETASIEAAGRSEALLQSQLDASRVPPPAPEKLVLTADQSKAILEKRKLSEQELTAFLASEQLKRINTQIQVDQLNLSNETNAGAQKLLTESILSQQLAAQKLQSEMNTDTISKQFKGTEILDVQNRNAAIESANQTHEENLVLIKRKAESDKLKIQKAVAATQLNNLQSSFSTIATLQESSSKELQAIGKAAAIANATIDGYAAVQKALASAPPPFNFAIAALVGVAAAANVAKIAGIGGGGGSAPKFETGGGGGIASSPSVATDLTPTQDLTRQEASTGIQVIIQGDVLDSDESGSRIVDLINKSFDKKGVVIQQGAFV